jgi:menaquinone-dependent protoporphyrinogen oxidase
LWAVTGAAGDPKRDRDKLMNVLVAYASKRGSTAEIARAVADTLQEYGLNVDCAEAGEVDSIEPYDAVVLGSAVYIKRWRGDARHFLRKHNKQLSRRPLWVFSSGPVGEAKGEVDQSWLEPPKIIEEVVRLGARGHVVFGGRLPLNPRGPMEHALVKNTPPEYRDRRDWSEIRAWAAGIASELGAAVPSA